MTLTCAALALALATPASAGHTLTLAPGQDCPTIKVTKVFDPPVTVLANGSTVHGLQVVSGGGLTWIGGTIMAPAGNDGAAAAGYAAMISKSSRVAILRATLTSARIGVVPSQSTDLEIAGNEFAGYRSDGIQMADVQRIAVVGNTFKDMSPLPTECTVPGQGAPLPSLAKADCTAKGGKWVDGDHPDAVQMRDNVTDAYIAWNTVRGRTQGLDQMDTAGDRPPLRVTIEHNDVMTDNYHQVTLGDTCIDCQIRWNTINHMLVAPNTTAKKAIIRPGAAAVCGNTVPDSPSTAGPKC